MPAAVDNANNPATSNAEDAPNKSQHSEQMWKVLKSHILRERARKKQEREAEVEEERLRKEREAREQQDVMTLGETREQISQLETKLQQLKDEKHQLFLQLKKVLNEDDNRRRQILKETSDMLALQGIPQGFVHQQLYIMPAVPRSAPVPQQPQGFKSCVKRPRSPSPQPAVPLYHQSYNNYKPVGSSAPYQSSPQKDDGRRHDIVRAVLWNKTSSQPCFYPTNDLSMYYQGPPPGPPTQSSIREAASRSVVYENRPPQPQPHPQQHSQPHSQPAYHIEQKIPEHYALRPPPSSHSHVIHGNALAISSQQVASPKGGYPVRGQTQYQQMPTAAPALYTAQSRPLYQSHQSPGTPMNYPQRD